MMSRDWVSATVGDCLDRSYRPTGYRIPKSSFCGAGRFPIIDQGSGAIAGWTDEERSLVTNGLPLIVFGDHTRTLKFVKTPFARGADGTQVLRAADGVDPRFLYYALRAIDLPSRGYNRHFTVLRESAIHLPVELEKQQQIGSVLAAVDGAVQRQEVVASTWRELKLAVLGRLLRDPGDPETESADGWSVSEIGDHFSARSGSTPSRRNPACWDGGVIPWVKTAEVDYGTIESTEEHITEAAVEAGVASVLPAGTILVAMYGQGVTRGKVARLGVDAACNQACAALNPTDDEVVPGYLYYYLEWQYEGLRGRAHGGNQQNLNLDIVRSFPLAYPGFESQTEVVRQLDLLTARIGLAEGRLELTRHVFDHLLYGLTSGEIDVGDLDLDAVAGISGSVDEAA